MTEDFHPGERVYRLSYDESGDRVILEGIVNLLTDGDLAVVWRAGPEYPWRVDLLGSLCSDPHLAPRYQGLVDPWVKSREQAIKKPLLDLEAEYDRRRQKLLGLVGGKAT